MDKRCITGLYVLRHLPAARGFGKSLGKDGGIKAPLPYKELSNVARSYNISGNCTGCGICRELCPAKSVQFGRYTYPEAEYKELARSSDKSRGQTSELLAAWGP
jgi:ferredoxin